MESASLQSPRHQRVLTALALEEPDRVPSLDVMEEFSNIYAALGKKPPLPLGKLFTGEYSSKLIDRIAGWINKSGLMDAEMNRFTIDRTAASVELGFDAAWVMHVPIWRFRDSKVVEDVYGRRYDVVLDAEGNLATPMYREGLITCADDWKRWNKRGALGLPERAYRVFRHVQRRFGDDVFIFASFLYGLFENTWQPMGFERYARAIRCDKPFVRSMIQFYEDHYCMMLHAWAEAGVPGCVYTDDMGCRNGPMVNPRLLEELYGDSLRRITETAHKLGLKIIIHSCGDVRKLLPWFADCGFDGVHALEPTAGVELGEAKQLVGDRMCLLGNMDITHILVDADRAEVFEAVKDSIAAAGEGGGYIIAPTNSHADISIERVRWMLEGVERYGSYPLQPGLSERAAVTAAN